MIVFVVALFLKSVLWFGIDWIQKVSKSDINFDYFRTSRFMQSILNGCYLLPLEYLLLLHLIKLSSTSIEFEKISR